MSESPADEIRSPLIPWLEQGLGDLAAAYVLGCTPEHLTEYSAGKQTFSFGQRAVVEALSQLQAEVATEFDEAGAAAVMRGRLSQLHPSGRVTLRFLHELATGVGDTADGGSELERCLASVTLDAYPAFLLPRDPRLPEMLGMEYAPIEVTRIILNHPKSYEFQAHVIEDPTLNQVFTEEREHGGFVGMGVRISVDDFGAGYTSIAQLKNLPVSELKVDRSFVSAMDTSNSDKLIVQSLIDLSHNLGLTAVAEGVEDPETMTTLTAYGCDIAQGYLLSRPMAADSIPAWHTAHTGSRDLPLKGVPGRA